MESMQRVFTFHTHRIPSQRLIEEATEAGEDDGEQVHYDQKFTINDDGQPQARRNGTKVVSDFILKRLMWATILVLVIVVLVLLAGIIAFGLGHHRRLSTILANQSAVDSVQTVDKLKLHPVYHHSNLSKTIKHNHTPPVKPAAGSNLDRTRRDFVRQMAREAWAAYHQHAWGHDSLAPATNSSHNDHFGEQSGRTIVSAMSTLWVMDLKEEFKQGEEWIEENFEVFELLNVDMNVADLTTDYIGGLLACYALTDDYAFLEHAHQLATHMAPAYSSKTGLPYEMFNPRTSTYRGSKPWFTWAGGQLLEYEYLAYLTDDPSIQERNDKMRKALLSLDPGRKGRYMEKINVELGKWENYVSTVSWASRQFYMWLAKSYLQTGPRKNPDKHFDINATWQAAARFVVQNQIFFDLKTRKFDESGTINLALGDVFGITDHLVPSGQRQMKYHSCYFPALLALNPPKWNASNFDPLDSASELAAKFTESCRLAANSSKTGLAPFKFYFDYEDEATNSKSESGMYEKGNFLNPELAETYFIMWRTTHNPKYRDYAWEMVRALHTHCRTPSGGYTQLVNVNELPADQQAVNYQPPYFLGGTLKYLYLVFEDDSVMPLDEWVFNSVGQPLPRFDHNEEEKFLEAEEHSEHNPL